MMPVRAQVLDAQDLTAREAAVLALLAEGAPDKVIAQALGIALKTVQTHLDRVYGKLGVRDARLNARCAAVSSAIARGMLSVSAKSLCVVLCVGAARLDDAALRVRVRLPRVQVTRVSGREAGC
ncbi:helix-turn-helix domain-containing protein [Methylomonas sp. MED-D]|uniref:helix-turn-helix domain-containing protein n=1 Tax=Methylomonas sp. MED-D TaxID=3418768 RepID=UPI003D083672